MKKSKKFLSILCTLCMILAMAAPASAAEIQPRTSTDQGYSFEFNWLTGKANSTSAPKDNSTSTYIEVLTLPTGGYQVYVDGFLNSKWTDCTDGNAFVTDKGTFLISQYVYENGGRTARLGAYKMGADRGGTGNWSADSVGTYPYLNDF